MTDTGAPEDAQAVVIPAELASRRDVTPRAKLVYGVILSHVGPNGDAFPGWRRIAGLAGVGVKTVRKAIDELHKQQVIGIERGGVGRSNRYSFPIQSVPPGGSAPLEVNVAPGGTASATHEGTPVYPRGAQNCCFAATDSAAARPGNDPAILQALTEAGIGEPTRGELTRKWAGIVRAPETIRRTVADMQTRGKGTGAIVNQLRTDAERLKAQRPRPAVTQAKQAADREQRQRERATEDRERQAIIDATRDAKLAEWKARAIAKNPMFRRQWEGADPRTHRVLQVAIITMMKAAGQLPPVAGDKATG